MDELLQQAMAEYGAKSVSAFAKAIGIPGTTVQTWSEGKLSRIGEALLRALLKVKELEREVEAIGAAAGEPRNEINSVQQPFSRVEALERVLQNAMDITGELKTLCTEVPSLEIQEPL